MSDHVDQTLALTDGKEEAVGELSLAVYGYSLFYDVLLKTTPYDYL